jgi:O-antigen polymerase
LYFFIILILITFAALNVVSNLITFQGIRSRTVLWGMSTICFLQAGYGFIQFLGWLPSNYSKFDITGSFDNPVGFAAILAMGFPIGLFLLAKAGKVERYLASAGLLIISIAIFLSCSRAGVLAILVSLVVFLLLQTKIMSKFNSYDT